MKQASLKLKRYAGNIEVSTQDLRSTLLSSILWYMGALALVYVLFLGSMVFNILARKSLEAEARTLVSEVGELELSYLSLSGKIDLEFSLSQGFVETKPQFTAKKSLGRNSGKSDNIGGNEI